MQKIKYVLCSALLLLSTNMAAMAQQRQLAMVVPLLDVSALKQSAYTDYTSGRFEAAVEKYRMIVHSPGSALADNYWLGEAYFHCGRFDLAAECFETASAANEEARVRAVESYIAAQQRTKAVTACSAKLSMANSAYTSARLKHLQKLLSISAPAAPARTGAAAKWVEKQ